MEFYLEYEIYKRKNELIEILLTSRDENQKKNCRILIKALTDHLEELSNKRENKNKKKWYKFW